MAKIIEKKGGYLVIIVGLMSLLFINTAFATQTNCTNNESSLVFKYVVPLRNFSNEEYIPITYATCNITIFEKQLNVDNVLNESVMGNRGDGDYDCWISHDFPDGKYNTFYTCTMGALTTQNFGRFEVVLSFAPVLIALALGILSGIFLFISFRSEDKVMNPLFFFLGILLLIVNMFIAGEISFDSRIKAIMFRLFGTSITLYMGGFILYVFLGYFMPFIRKAFSNKRTDEDVEAD